MKRILLPLIVFGFLQVLFSACARMTPVYEDYMASVVVPTPSDKWSNLGLNVKEESLANSWNSTAYSLLREVYSGSSIVISPLSLQTILSMTVSGTKGETARELRSFLCADQYSTQDIQLFCNKYLRGLPALDLSVSVRLVNAMIYSDRYEVNEEYRKQVEQFFYSSCAKMDFTNAQDVLHAVNDWCAQSTEGRIPEVLTSIHPDDVSYLLSSIFFKGAFDRFFLPKNTTEESFFCNDGTEMKIQMMHAIKRDFLYGEENDYQFASIYIGEQGAYCLTVVLPREGLDIGHVLTKLAARRDVLKGRRVQGDVYIPRINISSNLIMNDILQALGVRAAFTPTTDFTLIQGGDPFCIGNINQNTVFTLDEQGIDAASITITSTRDSAGSGDQQPVSFVADRPFAFFVTECSSQAGLVLFEGVFDGF